MYFSMSGNMLSYTCHDSGVCVMDDNVLKGLYIEERYSRKKHDGGMPKKCLQTILKEQQKIDDITVLQGNYTTLLSYLYPDSNIQLLDKFKALHHRSHASESIYTSGFEHCAVLTIDGYGDNTSIGIYTYKNNVLTEIRTYGPSESIGTAYCMACVHSFGGVNNRTLEGKFMGLAPYGIPYKEHIFSFDIETGLSIKGHPLTRKFFEYYPYADNDTTISMLHYANLAATVQRDFNDAIMLLVNYTKNITGETNLCLSGGCFQNVIINDIICESGLFENVWCSPYPNDGGLPLGDMVYYLIEQGKMPHKRIHHAYWGEEYPDEKILSYIDKEKYSLTDITPQEVAKLLSEDKILAWFQDRSEYGPRALGHRSLIGNPGNRENFNILNNKIKHRENWRPLAPSVPDELFDILFDVKSKDLTQFMLRSIPIREEWRSRIPAVCHVDGTTRPQRLERDINPEYYDMIMEFYKLTDLPCVINTSFNGPGEPIIENPKEALEFLDKTPELYGIVFNGKYLCRKNQF